MPRLIYAPATLLISLAVLALSNTPAMAFEGHALGASFGPGGVGSGRFSNPQGVAVDQGTGNVYVYDVGAGAVYKFSAVGTPEDFSALGSNEITGIGGFYEEAAQEISVDSSNGPDKGDIYVANNKVVRIYAESGSFLGELSGGEMCGVAVDPSGEVYVGIYPETVRRYAPVTNPVTNVEETGSITGVREVCNVAADSAGDVYAADYSGGITKYDAQQFGSPSPTGISVDPRGRTLAVGAGNSDVYIDELEDLAQYSPAGALLARLGDGGSNALTGSQGVAINTTSGTVGSGDVYVSSPSSTVDIYTPVTVPTTNTDLPGSITGTTAVLHGDVEDPGSIAGGVGYYFSYNRGSSCVGPGSSESTPDDGGANATGSGDVHEETMISGLEVSTTYTVCFVTSSSGGEVFGQPQQLTTSAAASPGLESESASSVGASTATLQAQINPEKEETTCGVFQYLTESEFDASQYATPKTVACEPSSLGEGETGVSVEAGVAGLQPATRYHYRVLATNHTGTSTGTDQTFTTLPLPPEVSTGQASPATGSSETITGTVNPQGNDLWETTYRIQYGLSIAYGSQTQGQAGSGDTSVEVSGVISEPPSGTYHYRIVAKNAGGETVGVDQTFTIAGIAPVIGAESAQFVNENSATILADLNPDEAETTYEVQYGTSTAYGASTPPAEIVALTSSQGTITAITGLQPGTTYHYRLTATSPAGSAYGQDQTFRTSGATPTTAFTSFTVPTVPQIAPAPYTFPTEKPETGVSTKKALTNAQKLAAALKVCAKKKQKQRAGCEKQAHKKYPTKPKKTKPKKK
jgi:hypothetical protein